MRISLEKQYSTLYQKSFNFQHQEKYSNIILSTAVSVWHFYGTFMDRTLQKPFVQIKKNTD